MVRSARSLSEVCVAERTIGPNGTIHGLTECAGRFQGGRGELCTSACVCRLLFRRASLCLRG